MYDPEEEEGDAARPGVDWDAWEKNRFTGWRRWWIILMVATVAAATLGLLINGVPN
jgi:hypothetical protein